MSTKNSIKIKLIYGDYTERTYSMDCPVEPNQDLVTYMKERINAFNTAANTADSTVQQTFISDNGSPTTGVSEAVIETQTEEVIYNG